MGKAKHIILAAIACCAAGGLHAQHYIGVRGGYGGGFGRFYPATESPRYNQKFTMGLWSGGVTWKYYSPEKYVGGVGAEVEFLQRGFEYHLEGRNSDSTYRRTINAINVPIIWQPHLNMADNRLRVFLNAGLYVSYNMSSRQDTIVGGNVVHSSPYQMRLERDNLFGYGLLGGVGMNYIYGKWEFQIEARYYISYGDVLRHRNRFPGERDPDTGVFINNPFRSPTDNVSLSLGVFYRIGDKPHAPPPSPRAIRRKQERLAGKERKQALKEEEKAERDARKAERDARRAAGSGNVNEKPAEDEKTTEYGNDQTTESSETNTEGHQ